MNKFPALQILRLIYALIGWSIIIIGSLGSLGLALMQTEYGYNDFRLNFNAPIFIAGVVITFIVSGHIIITAEAISVLLRIEDHLDRILYGQERNQKVAEIASQNIPEQNSDSLLERLERKGIFD